MSTWFGFWFGLRWRELRSFVRSFVHSFVRSSAFVCLNDRKQRKARARWVRGSLVDVGDVGVGRSQSLTQSRCHGRKSNTKHNERAGFSLSDRPRLQPPTQAHANRTQPRTARVARKLIFPRCFPRWAHEPTPIPHHHRPPPHPHRTAVSCEHLQTFCYCETRAPRCQYTSRLAVGRTKNKILTRPSPWSGRSSLVALVSCARRLSTSTHEASIGPEGIASHEVNLSTDATW